MDLDITYCIQFALFLVCLVTLNSLILKPFLGVIQAREAKLGGAQEDIVRLTAQADDARDSYQIKMRVAAQEAQRRREALRAEGRDEERRILNQVRAAIADKLNHSRQGVEDAEASARGYLAAEVRFVGEDLASKVLGRKIGSS
jgi:F0F1-type ATP synthase membrane subunit b/b'